MFFPSCPTLHSLLPIATGTTFALALSCGSSTNNSADLVRFQGQDMVIKDASELSSSEGSLSGTGEVVFNQPLGLVGSGSNFSLAFTLEDGGDVELVTYAETDLSKGFGITFRRQSDQLQVQLAAASGLVDASHPFEDTAADAAHHLSIDIHNNEDPTHVLIWNAASISGLAEAALEEIALVNTEHDHASHDAHEEHHHEEAHEEETDIASPGRGAGTFWGLRLKRATVTRAARSTALLSE